MKKNLLLAFCFISIFTLAQKIKTDNLPIWCTVLPKIILPDTNFTFSCVVLENPQNAKFQSTTMYQGLNWEYETAQLIDGFKKVAPTVRRSVAITIRTEEFNITSKTSSPQQSVNATTGAAETNYTFDLKANYILRVVAVSAKGDTILKISRNQGQISSMNYPYSIQPTGMVEKFVSSGQAEAGFNKNLNDINILARKICSIDFLKFLKDTLNSMVGFPSAKLFFEIA